MSKFKVGDKVRCVLGDPPALVRGKVYTVSRDIGCGGLIYLDEVPTGWRENRFEPEPVEPAPAQTQTLVIKQAAADAVRAEWDNHASQILARYRANPVVLSGHQAERGPERIDPMSVIVPAVPPRIVDTKWGPVEVERGNKGQVTYVYCDGVEQIRLPVVLLFELDPGLDPCDPNVVARCIADHDSWLDTRGKERVEDEVTTVNRIREARQQEQAAAEAARLPGPGTACEWGEP